MGAGVVEQLVQFAQPIDPAQAGDPNGFRHEFPAGTNVIGAIPGGPLLGGAVAFVDALTTGECDGFLD